MQRNENTSKAIEHIDVRVFAHATENQQSVETAVKNIFPEEIAQSIIFKETKLAGHHSNPIVLVSAKIDNKKLLPSALERFGENLNTLDKEQLNQEIELHLERSNLFLRFDKQAAFLQTLKFSTDDPIHIKIHFKNKTAQEITDLVKLFGLIP